VIFSRIIFIEFFRGIDNVEASGHPASGCFFSMDIVDQPKINFELY